MGFSCKIKSGGCLVVCFSGWLLFACGGGCLVVVYLWGWFLVVACGGGALTCNWQERCVTYCFIKC